MKKIDVSKLSGTEFQKIVWRALQEIPKGQTVTYKELAATIGKPDAFRAVANAIGRNPCVPDIPCHRVVRSDGKLGGYSGEGGVRAKRALLVSEKADLSKVK